MKHIKYRYIAGQRKTLIAVYLKIGTFTHSYKYFSQKIKPKFLNFRDKLDAEYWVPESEINVMNELGIKYFHKNFAKNILKEIKKHNLRAWELVQLISKSDFKKLSNKKLINICNQVCDTLIELMGTLFLSQDVYTKLVEDRIIELLKKQFQDEKKISKYFNILITSYKRDAIQKELIKWYKFVLKHWEFREDTYLNYILENSWLIYNTFTMKEVIDFVNKRYLKTKRLGRKKIEKNINNFRIQERRKKEKLINSIEAIDSEVRLLAKILRDLAEERLEVKLATNSLETIFNLKFLYFISEKYNIDFMDILDGYFPEDIIALISKGNIISARKISDRKKFIGFIGKDGKIIIIEGSIAENKIRSLLSYSLPQETNELKGQIAAKGEGNIIGKARIINLSDNKKLQEDFSKFNKGDIIVTIMTQPNIMPIANKAAGIVTDEGGVCSHAAIISRELNIPCLVGTQYATKIVKDGSLIKIDVEEGKAYILDN